ncbi:MULTISPECIES: hypothetical protein [Halomonadaceae]|uniref:hypothetical protein n=1 Tax=Halomonadaceae TaxID=28256 RepID=UPI000C32C36F|nr:hypothetical protein [Halomonas sp. MES3-P3E]PKG50921.1 hypothetical protein CXF87_10625 [Halomonas sp. MES3-P3E]
MKSQLSIIASIFGFIFLSLSSPAAAQSTLHVCHSGGPRVLAVVYETYNGLMQNYSVSGWHILENHGCYREWLMGRDIRSFAFAALNENRQLVALPFDFNLARSSFPGSVKAICIPVTEDFEPFEETSSLIYHLTPPCRDGHVPLTTSFSIRGGTDESTMRMNVPGVANLPSPDQGYARVWEEKFGQGLAERREEEQRKQQEQQLKHAEEQRNQAERAASQAREAERRQKKMRFEAHAKRLGVLADERQVPVEETIKLFSDPEYGCEGLGDEEQVVNEFSEAEISQFCSALDKGLTDAESQPLSELEKSKADAWDVSGFLWPGLSMCSYLIIHESITAVLDKRKDDPGYGECNDDSLEKMRSLAAEIVGFPESTTLP